MKRLTDTWRQKKPLAGIAVDAGLNDGALAKSGYGTKRLGRVAIAPSKRVGNNHGPESDSSKYNIKEANNETQQNSNGSKCFDVSFTSSFGPDFDADVISAVNSLEQGFTELCDQPVSACFRDGSSNWPPSPKTPSKQVQHRAGGAAKPGKRKNSRTRKSGILKPSLFGDSAGNSFLADAVTPSHSPADKKRRENTPTPATKKDLGKTGPQTKKNFTRLALHDGSVLRSPSKSGQAKSIEEKKQASRKQNGGDISGNDFEDFNQNCEEDERIEIETDVSPAASHVLQDAKKGAGEHQTGIHPPTPGRKGCAGKVGFGKDDGSVRKPSAHFSHVQIQRSSSRELEKDKGASLLISRTEQYKAPSDRIKHKANVLCPSPKKPASSRNGTSSLVAVASKNNSGQLDNFTSIRCETRKDSECKTVANDKPKSGTEGKGAAVVGVSSTNTTTEKGFNTDDRRESVERTKFKPAVDDSKAAADHATENAASSTDNPGSLLLSKWGLPSPVLEAYHSQGITTMFPWQAECLTTGNVLGGGNLVYSAPTSAGKTMVAELLVLKRVLETRRKALFILPFVSVTREKMISLQRLYQDAGLRVGGFMGSHSPAGGFQSLDVAVCTIEKGNGLVNRLLEDNRIDELGAVVIDELHMVGDSNRGYLLELLLTKVCYMAHKSRESGNTHPVQVIGMSATLPNLDLLARWLDANLYHTDFRPVPLTENIKVGSVIYDGWMNKVREVEVRTTFKGDEDQIIPLCLETLMGGHSVLIFCPTKVWCEKMAEKIARVFYELVKNPTALAVFTGETGFVKASAITRLPIDQNALMNVLEQLGRSPVGVDPMLGKVIQYGVAYHHAGLTFDERDIVEGAFRQGLLKVLVATSTLSSGVNLPARRVIVRSPMFGGRVMDTLSYKQMAGRAGRKGVDTEGECILVCKEGEKRAAQNLLQADLPPVTSCLSCGNDGTELSRSMKRAILEVVVSGVASTPDDVARYTACTLLSASLPPDSRDTDMLISACLKFLEDNEFVRLQTVSDANNEEVRKYQPTQLGSAVLASSMSPDEGLAVFAELQKARQCFVLSSELHIIYLVTPVYSQDISANLDWYHFYCLWEKLSPDMRSVAKVVGVEEGFLAKAITGRVPTKTPAQTRAVAIHRRFYTALALHDLVREVPLMEVARRYHCNKGQLQSLMQSAATFAGMVTVFCARLGWSNMELLLSQFQQRLTLGVTRELCDLVRIPLLTGTMARILFNAGYQTVAAVAHAQATDLENVFRKAAPFQTNKKQDGESDWDLEQRRKARCVWLAGRQGVTELEAATAIMEEAKSIIQQELGVRIDWQASAVNTRGAPEGSVSISESTGELSVCRTPRINARTSDKVSPVESGQKQNSAECSRQRSSEVSPPSSSVVQRNTVHVTPGNRSRRVLSGRSWQKRNSGGGGVTPYVKSPPSSRRTSDGSSISPKEVSFFGQVVVSPPPLMRSLASGAQSPPAGSVTDDSKNPNKSVDTMSKESPPALDKLPKPVPFPSGSTAQVNIRTVSASDSVAYTKSATSLTSSHIVTTPKGTLHGTRQRTLSKSSASSGSARMSALRSSTKDVSENTAAETLCTSITTSSDQQQSTVHEVEADSETGYNCFDDSLILDSQTAHLLSAGVCGLGEKKSPQGVTTSTPVHTTGKTENRDILTTSSEHERPVRNNGVSGASSRFVTQSETQTRQESCSLLGLTAAEEVSPGLHLEPKVIIVNSAEQSNPSSDRGMGLRQCEPKNPSLEGVSPSAHQVDLDNFDDDLFRSPLLAMSFVDHDKNSGVKKNTEPHLPSGVTGPTKSSHQSTREDVQMTVEDVSENLDAEEDTSCELIAASNYERLAYVEEGVTADDSVTGDANLSYQDLGITQNGDLVCRDRDPEERFVSVKDVEERPIECRPSNDVAAEYDFREDLAVAMNLSDSFSSLMECSLVKSSSRVASEAKPAPVSAEHNLDTAAFTNSFSASVLERAMADDMFSEQLEDPTDVPVAEAPHQTSDVKNHNQKMPAGQKCSKSKKKSSDSSAKREEPVSPEMHGTRENRSSRDSTGSLSNRGSVTPQNEGDLVPPTPPDEASNASNTLHSPCLRRTPLRACRNRTENSLHPKSQVFPSSHVKEQKRRPKDKENAAEKHKHSLLKAKPNSHSKDEVSSAGRNVSGCAATVQNKDVVRPDPEGKVADAQTKDKINVPDPAANACEARDDCGSVTVSSSPPLTQESFTIIDVCADAGLFKTFVAEWKRKEIYAISLACEPKPAPQHTGGGIGGNFMRGKPCEAVAIQPVPGGVEIPGDQERVIVGLAVSWENRDAYYISLATIGDSVNASLDDTMAAPPTDDSISHEQRIQAVKDILNKTVDRKHSGTVISYDVKSVYNVLVRGLGIAFGQCRDPQIASWLLDPGAKEKTVHGMVTNYLPEDMPLLEGIGGGVGYGSLGLTVRSAGSGRMRAATESIISRRLMDYFWTELVSAGLETAFTDVEMPSVITMARTELNGFGFSEEECESQKSLMMTKLSALEQDAYRQAGHPFCLTSTDDVAQVLYLELQLPVNGDPSASKPTRTLGPSRRAKGRQKSAFSTSKDILEKLKPYHPLPGVILEWRRISSALTKHVYPLQKEKAWSERLGMHRMFGECQLHTATGRVSMSEPNLQNIPKDFDITMPDVIGESPPATGFLLVGVDRHGKRSGNSRLQTMRGVVPQSALVSDPITAKQMAVSMRHAFIPFDGGVMVAADYSQLELRVIAHLSGDRKLTSILNDDGDVFKLIAAQWKNTLPEAVTAEQRQQAKQVCYGMLYGIGAKALGEQLGVEENDAAAFIETFKAKYTGMRSYLRQTVEKCRELGYVTTITGRRRYLPAIKDTKPHARAQAERQAVNTTVQGSAADIVKAAMNKIDRHLAKIFPDTRHPHRHLDADIGRPCGAFLVLQLHDELIYEVSQGEVTQVARIIQQYMENTTRFSVRLPVKVKVGPSWGRLKEL